MKSGTLEQVCCPDCKNRLTLRETQLTDGEIVGGILECRSCGKSFPVLNGVPRMIMDLGERQGISRSWGYQWAKMAEGALETDTYYGQTEEQELASFFDYLNISPENVAGKKVLDAGCGCGRLTRALGGRGARVIGMDIASSIEGIYGYCRLEPTVDIVQGDIMNPPFPDASFDYISCKLALCYLSDPEKGFKNLARLVKPGGRLFISLPDKEHPAFTVRLKDLLRITHRIPQGALIYVCRGLAPALWAGRAITRKPGNSMRTSAFLLFNALHTKFSRHTDEELVAWFAKENFSGITKVKGVPHSVNVRGTRT